MVSGTYTIVTKTLNFLEFSQEKTMLKVDYPLSSSTSCIPRYCCFIDVLTYKLLQSLNTSFKVFFLINEHFIVFS
jgi:hypothetical protein